MRLQDLPERQGRRPSEPLRTRQLAFGYTQEDLRVLLAPMAAKGEEPIGSMGNDISLAVLSDQAPPLFSYFKQLFAQVTNPPIDPIRESVVMSIKTGVGSEANLLDEGPDHAHQLVIPHPILRNHELESLRGVDSSVFRSHTIPITWPVAEGAEGMVWAVRRIAEQAAEAIAYGANIIVLSDRGVGPTRAAIPSLLAVAAVHHHLVREGTRLRTGLVVESGEPREVHHFATLIGYGASAINPYLMFESLADIVGDTDAMEQAQRNVVKAIGKGLLKTLSKMGISTIQSYNGAQIFEAIGLAPELVERHFTGTASRIGGIGLDVLARETLQRHLRAYPDAETLLPVGGVYAWRRDGEHHQWNPSAVAKLQHAVRHGGRPTYDEWAREVNEDDARRASLRGLIGFKDAAPIPLDEVEPASEIVKRFATGAMSLGSLSREAHETLAIAMNRLGGKSNTGEGGEDASRYTPDPNGDSRRSAIKQVASGRFGVTIHYLTNADEIQIKMAQGAKPGEGGQLPGHKVDGYIGKIRNSTPGVGLISPPPHHDIYSIEDLKQLIYDLRCANPGARISVKLVAEVGVGTVAAGVAKAGADHILISGHDGGTGASPLSSLQAAGSPWEIGLAETQQTLMMNDLRSRVWVQADGQMKTGRDVVIAAALGADEVGFSTAPLIAAGCIMMRACHLNTCPVGIATQDPELRRRFEGTPEHVVNYLFFVAEEARELMAQLGVRTYDDLIGRVELLEFAPAVDHWKARGIDLSLLLAAPAEAPADAPRRRITSQLSPLPGALDWDLIEAARDAIDHRKPVTGSFRIRNVHRTVGGLLSHWVAKVHGAAGLPPETVRFRLDGSAGQSFGAWLAPGVELSLVGDANDYCGKGLSGGVLSVRPPDGATFAAEENVIVGNTVLYGATAGRAFFRGLAGERFAVRNSGASAVVEGVGDHGCEYMTGGRVVILGPTGRNFAAGMSGGIAYVHDPAGTFGERCNMDLVGFDAIGEADAIELHELDRGAPPAHALAGRRAAPRGLGRGAGAVRQGHAARLQARAGRPGQGRAGDARGPRARRGRRRRRRAAHGHVASVLSAPAVPPRRRRVGAADHGDHHPHPAARAAGPHHRRAGAPRRARTRSDVDLDDDRRRPGRLVRRRPDRLRHRRRGRRRLELRRRAARLRRDHPAAAPLARRPRRRSGRSVRDALSAASTTSHGGRPRPPGEREDLAADAAARDERRGDAVDPAPRARGRAAARTRRSCAPSRAGSRGRRSGSGCRARSRRARGRRAGASRGGRCSSARRPRPRRRAGRARRARGRRARGPPGASPAPAP